MAIDAVGRLRDLDAFPGASESDLQAIVKAGAVVTVPSRWSLIWDRTPADKAYVLLEGTAEVRRNDQVIATLVPGELIGEAGIVRRKLRSATVTSTEPLTVLHLTREAVEELYAGMPVVRRALDAATLARS